MWDKRTAVTLTSLTLVLALLVAGVLAKEYRALPDATTSPSSLTNAAFEARRVYELTQIQRGRDEQRMSSIYALRSALEAYRAAKGTYPITLNQLVPNQITSIPADPLTSEPYTYMPQGSGPNFYLLTYTLEYGAGGVNAGAHQATPNGIATP